MALFKGLRFVLRVALEALKPTIADTVSSFNTDADVLSRLLEAESFAVTMEIRDEQIETLSAYTQVSFFEHLKSNG